MYIGLDVGTTSLSAVLLDVVQGQILAHQSLEHRAQFKSQMADSAEIDLARLQSLSVEVLAMLVSSADIDSRTIRGIGLTGQQHGVALLGPENQPLGPAITWQDRRAEREISAGSGSYMDAFFAAAGGTDAFSSTGCRPAAGFLGTTLFRLQWDGALADLPPDSQAVFIPDAIGAFLTGSRPRTDSTLAASSGIFDIVDQQWSPHLLDSLGISEELLPPIAPAGAPLGGLRRELAEEIGLEGGLPVGVALGDNQASFVGSVAEPGRSLLVNVGTGGQLSARVDEVYLVPGLEARPFPENGTLLIGGGLFGGRSYAYLIDFFRTVGRDLFSDRQEESLYERVNELAARAPAGCDGLICEPFFTGSRIEPDLRGSFRGISPQNFRTGHFARALLEGMAEGFSAFHELMAPYVGERSVLVGSGNGIRRNRLLAQIVADRFGMDLQIPAFTEEAAAGAALLAAVSQGACPSLQEAARLLTYSESVSSTLNA